MNWLSVILGSLALLINSSNGKEMYKSTKEKPTLRCGLPVLEAGIQFHVNAEGNLVSYGCGRGRKSLGSTYAVCEKGQWSNAPPKCIARGCGLTYQIPNGHVILGYDGALQRFQCDADYQLIGSSILTCNGRTWNGTVPKCEDPNHREVKQVSALKSIHSKTHDDWLSEADYSCIKRKTSIRPPTIENTHAFIKWMMKEGKPRLYTTYRCTWGYVPRGASKNLYCQNGQWIGAPPKCTPTANPIAVSPGSLALQRDISKMTHDEWLMISDYTCLGTADNPHRLALEEVANGLFTLKYTVYEGTPRLYAVLRCNLDYQPTDTDENTIYCMNRTWMGHMSAGCSLKPIDTGQQKMSCENSNGGCSHVCNPGGPHGVTCSCNHGYRIDSDGSLCIDIDECNDKNGGCAQICRNADGNHQCHCFVGYELDEDGQSCNKIEQPVSDNDLIPPIALFHQ